MLKYLIGSVQNQRHANEVHFCFEDLIDTDVKKIVNSNLMKYLRHHLYLNLIFLSS